MGMLEFGGHVVRGSPQKASFKHRKHHPIGHGVGVHRSGGAGGGGWCCDPFNATVEWLVILSSHTSYNNE